MTSDYARAFADALFREVRAEMGRQGIGSVRALADRLGTKNHTSVNDRLSLDKADRIPINAEDLASYCEVFGIEPHLLVVRAESAMLGAAARRGDDLVERARADVLRRAAEAQGPADAGETGEEGAAAPGA